METVTTDIDEEFACSLGRMAIKQNCDLQVVERLPHLGLIDSELRELVAVDSGRPC